uniref:Uncharacterized protein n=1 Tax=Avena sativa TaxID=4498 RepID=A0ACD5VUB9_AVESA
MVKNINVHHVDKAAFLKGDVECDPEEVVMVFGTSPTYVEVVERERNDLKWMDPSDVYELVGRYNVGFGHHNRLKIIPINSELNWSAYKKMVVESEDKSLEIFATRKIGARLHIDLNRHASMSSAQGEPHVYDTTMSQPPLSLVRVEPTYDDTTMRQPSMSPVQNDNYEATQMEDDDLEGDEVEHGLRDNEVGDVEANCDEEDMDHDLLYLWCHASDSEDEGLD